MSPTSEKRYFFINEEKNWNDARAYCNQHHTDLASVRNETENAMIQSKLPNNQLVWIGLNRMTWQWWSDGQKNNLFANWANGHPLRISDTCAASVINATLPGKWMEHNCGTKLHFMCQNSELFHFCKQLCGVAFLNTTTVSSNYVSHYQISCTCLL